MKKKSLIYTLFIVSALPIIFYSCSAEKNTMVSKSYHNLAAHYNAYFIAKEHLRVVENAFYKNSENNYNKILRIYPEVDTSKISSVKQDLEEVIKKASIAIQRHKNSKWVDDSYILVGKARYYNADFVNAIQTFKYVNTKGEDKNARHEALINLIRTFVDAQEQNNAVAVSDFLKKEKLNKDNLQKLYLARAHLYQIREDYNNMVGNLILAAPLMSKKDGKAKIYFIIGQVYQKLKFDSEAYKNYKESLSNNPDFELAFYAKLHMAQVSELSDASDVKKTRKFYQGLLKDSKNKDFKDKIYYELGQFELKQENLDAAIEHYNMSIRASAGNRRQKAFSYLRLAEIYYDKQKKYELAKNYYDSTVTEMPQDEEVFKSVQQRQKVLGEFVAQLNTIQLQDSLLRLSEMDSVSLMAFIDKTIEEQKQEEQQKAAVEAQRATVRNSKVLPGQAASFELQESGNSWYFYNTTAVGMGQTEFVRKWGNRKLEDNWRRSAKGASVAFDTNKTPVGENPSAQVTESLSSNTQSGQNRDQMYQAIPKTPEEKAAANEKIEKAYFRLGSIYNFDLEEKSNASNTFETLLERFPKSEFKPEVLYLLYLINKDSSSTKSEEYKKMLISEFPNSTFAKIAINPHYKEESEKAGQELQVVYKEAYELYKIDSLKQSLQVIKEGMRKYPDNDFFDNLRLLEIFIIGKTESITNYQFQLEKFIEEYPDSELNDYAKHLLKSTEEALVNMAKANGAAYIKEFDEPHSFILVYNQDNRAANELPKKMDEFVLKNFSSQNLRIGNLVLNDKRSMIVVSEFADKVLALQFYSTFNKIGNEYKAYESADVKYFIISKDNLQIFYQTKDLNNYLTFFEKNYN